MSHDGRPLQWFYHEFGLASVHQTGFNAYAIILARTLRMFAYGNSLILAIFLAELQFSDFQIGVFMTFTLLGDVVLGLFLTLVADRVGRRKILVLGSILMIGSGLVLVWFENFWILLLAAIVGVISATGGDFGPFRSIEESMLSQLTTQSARSDVLAWYVTTSGIGSALGSEVCGRLVRHLQGRDGWRSVDAYHALFWLNVVMGVLNALLSCCLSSACELPLREPDSYVSVSQGEQSTELRVSGDRRNDEGQFSPAMGRYMPLKAQGWWSRVSVNFSSISQPTKRTMYKLWFLLAIDSVSDGMVPYSLTNYYIDKKYHPSKSTLGDVTSAAYFLGAVSAVFAGPLARRIGLINTMVFTHIPSSAAVLIFPIPNFLAGSAILLLIRAALNPMDQAPRSAFIAAVVRPEERTAVMGITSMVRTLAAMLGPSITGLLAGAQHFWAAFVAGGILRLTYDIGLYVMFRSTKVGGEDDEPVPATHEESDRLWDSDVEGIEANAPRATTDRPHSQ